MSFLLHVEQFSGRQIISLLRMQRRIRPAIKQAILPVLVPLLPVVSQAHHCHQGLGGEGLVFQMAKLKVSPKA